jgi:hypothetical protein
VMLQLFQFQLLLQYFSLHVSDLPYRLPRQGTKYVDDIIHCIFILLAVFVKVILSITIYFLAQFFNNFYHIFSINTITLSPLTLSHARLNLRITNTYLKYIRRTSLRSFSEWKSDQT